MTVDLSTARAGCDVQFRCGGVARLHSVHIQGSVRLHFGGGGPELWWNPDGRFTTQDHPLDIVSIADPPLTEAERWQRIAEIAEKTDRLIERVLLDQDHFDFGAWRKRNAEILALAEGRAP